MLIRTSAATIGRPAVSSGRLSRLAAPWLVCLLAALICLPTAQAQFGGDDFETDAVTFLSNRSDQPRLDLHVRVPYQNLRFVRRGDGFLSNYSVTAAVHRAGRNDAASALVARRSWNRRVEAAGYGATQSDSLADYSTHALELPPGRYVVRFRLEGQVGAHVAPREQVVEVPPLADTPSMSDLVLTDRYDARSRNITPNVGGNVSSDQSSFTLFFEVYANEPERLRAHYTIRPLGADRRPGRLARLFGRGNVQAAPIVEFSEWVVASAGRSPAARTFETDRFDIGDYEIAVRLERSNGALVAERSRSFTIRWTGLFEQLQDLDVAIAQLRYIAKDREIRAMREAATFQERLSLFQEFWDKRDPSPGSRRNERMEEYYFRVAHAARNYGRLEGTGWQTDQGEVYIRFGEPDRVENRSGSGNSRTSEIWYYNRIGLRFIFVDDAGSGEFRLLAPIGDARTRM